MTQFTELMHHDGGASLIYVDCRQIDGSRIRVQEELCPRQVLEHEWPGWSSLADKGSLPGAFVEMRQLIGGPTCPSSVAQAANRQDLSLQCHGHTGQCYHF